MLVCTYICMHVHISYACYFLKFIDMPIHTYICRNIQNKNAKNNQQTLRMYEHGYVLNVPFTYILICSIMPKNQGKAVAAAAAVCAFQAKILMSKARPIALTHKPTHRN